ncbi:hypothetical protein [Thalassotalea marina]|uniref:WD40 repeat domain-containing protein n=1 Tax=Thalassotalea marina TaxID=1673741 RepID=A0A919BJ97_9GAMM|nr:hypothetical protein [Thalassotalea marina]GHF94773.1 hypothetical protein GCM10017161_23810 [Thalassotalea marina]
MYKAFATLVLLSILLLSSPVLATLNFQLDIIPNPYQAHKGTRAILVDADGSHLVLYGVNKDNKNNKIPMVFHWNERDGHSHLGLLNNRNTLLPMDISDDGKVIVGHNGGDSFIWTKQDKMRTVPKLKSHYLTTAISISADGKTVVGYTGWQSDVSAFRWEIGAKPTEIGTGLNKVKWRNATHVSADASVIVGSAQKHVYRWNNNVISSITSPSGCYFIPEDVSHDGKTIGGRCSVDTPIIWHESNGFTTLPIPQGAASAIVKGMSGDGKKLFGTAKYKGENYTYSYRPILWYQEQIYFLDDIVKKHIPNQAIKQIRVNNISSNGKVLVGGYKDSIDHYYPFKLTLKE